MKIPSKQTLRKYGLSEQEWIALYNEYDGACHCCGKKPSPQAKRALHTDHEHVKNWKNLPPEKRKQYCRGLLCYSCNSRLLQRGNDNIKKLTQAIEYLERYEVRRTNILSK